MRFPRVKAEGQSFYHCVSPERSRCRTRYFTDGLILGSQSFVESRFYNLKHKLGYQLRRPATRLTALGCADTLWIFRDLRVRPIS